jgi:methylphosphotriester-DNA--protein-cysteine methyltransferase
MKRHLRSLLVVASALVILGTLSGQALAKHAGPTRSPAAVAPAGHGAVAIGQAKTADNGDTIVYITKTGKKYHADGCRSLAKSRIPIKLRDAVARGFTACSICKPPALTAGQEAAVPPTAAPPAPAARTAPAQDNGDVTVYITTTGAKYHRAGCRSLAKSSIPIKLREAVAKGYSACKLCNPPALTKK